MEGSFLASPGAGLWGSTRVPFPSPGFTVPMDSGPSKLLQALRPQPEFLHRSRFFSFVILTGQFSDIFPSAGSASRADMHYLSSQHCPSPGTSRGCTNACQPCSFFPQFFISQQMFGWAPWGCSFSLLHGGEKSLFLQGGRWLRSRRKLSGCSCHPPAGVSGTRLPRPLLTLTQSQHGGTNCLPLIDKPRAV